jgi:hypothetical protein
MKLKSLLSTVSLFALFITASPLAVAGGPNYSGGTWRAKTISHEDPMWDIQTDLSSDHPCAVYGGVWRGWCMDTSTGQIVEPSSSNGVPYSTSRGRIVRANQNICRGDLTRSERRACQRAKRAALYGGTFTRISPRRSLR